MIIPTERLSVKSLAWLLNFTVYTLGLVSTSRLMQKTGIVPPLGRRHHLFLEWDHRPTPWRYPVINRDWLLPAQPSDSQFPSMIRQVSLYISFTSPPSPNPNFSSLSVVGFPVLYLCPDWVCRCDLSIVLPRKVLKCVLAYDGVWSS